MAEGRVMAATITSIPVRSVGDNFAFVHLVVDGWSIHGIRVRHGAVEWPTRADERGKVWPVATPPPEIRDQLERAILDAYTRATS